MDLTSVSSFSEPTWRSPGANGHHQPFAEIEVLSQAEQGNVFGKLRKRFFANLINKHMMFRRRGTPTWYLGLGVISGCLG
eukprot:7185446-Pyramimonas_sp.AAC.1